jgi:hypothetical protein
MKWNRVRIKNYQVNHSTNYKGFKITIEWFSGKNDPIFWSITRNDNKEWQNTGNEIKYEYSFKSLKKELISKIDNLTA